MSDPVLTNITSAVDVEMNRREVAQLEQLLIGAILLDERVLRFAVDEVRGDEFVNLNMGELYEQLVNMGARREPIDVVTVAERLPAWGIRGIEAVELHKFVTMVSSSDHVSWYAARIREGAFRRAIQAEAMRLAAVAGAAEPGLSLTTAIEHLRALMLTRMPSVKARALVDVLDGPDAYDWVIDGLLERRDRLVITGTEGGGKSMLMRQIAIMSSAGIHPFTHFPITPNRGLFIDAENSEMQWRRQARAMFARASQLGSAGVLGLACINRIDISRDRDLAVLHRLIDDWAPDVIYIGPLYRLLPRAITNDDDATPVLAALDTLRDRGVALVLEAHAGHATGAGGIRDMRPRGSAALLGWPEFGLGLRPVEAVRDRDVVELTRWRGDRDERSFPKRLARGADWPWVPAQV